MADNLPVKPTKQLPSIYFKDETPTNNAEPIIDQYIDVFSKRLKENSQSIDDYIELGNLFRQKKQYQKAFKLHRNLLVRKNISKDQKIRIFGELGYDYLYSKTKDLGLDYFESALRLDRKNIYALKGQYQAYRMQRKHHEAIDSLTQINKLDPTNKIEMGTIYSELAMIAFFSKDIPSAKKWHKKAQNHPQTPFLLLSGIQIHMLEGKQENALTDLQKFILDYPQHAQFAIQKLENILFESKQYDRYIQMLTNISHESPNNFHVHHALAKYFEKTKQLDKAKSHFLKAMDLSPTHVQIFKDGCTFLQNQSDDTAIETMHTFLQNLTQNRTYSCGSCTRSFSSIPKDCQICHGWNIFDLEYTVKQS